jgi:type II secretion system protein N
MTTSESMTEALLAFRNHKMKIVFAVFAFVFFLVVLFPYDDLSDLVTEKVAQATQNQVFLRFERLGLAAFPPSLALDQVEVDTPFLPTLKAASMTLAPSIARLLAFSPGASFSARDLFKGNLYGSVGTKTQKDIQKIDFSVDYEKFDLKTTGDFFDSSWPIQGQATIGVKGLVEMEFTEQPEAELEITIDKMILPNTLPSTIPFVGGTQIPQIQFSKVRLQGRLINREFIIDSGSFGEEKDVFRGLIKGKLQLTFVRMGQQIQPQFGPYDLRVDLQMDRGFEADLQRRLTIVYDMIGRYKTATGKGARYMMRVSGTNFYNPPNVTAISSL